LEISAILLDTDVPPKGYKVIVKEVTEIEIVIEPAAPRHQSRSVGFEQLDDSIGCIFVRRPSKTPQETNPTPRWKQRKEPEGDLVQERFPVAGTLPARPATA
jgi:hypothetical protein